MRAPVIGAFFVDQPELRQSFGRALAEVTHRDTRAVEGALFVAEVAAACCRDQSMEHRFETARAVVREASLGGVLDRALTLAAEGAAVEQAAEELGTSGFILHTTAFASFCLFRGGPDPLTVLSDAIAAGGDTDTIGAILGAWLGTVHGEAALPPGLLGRIHDGPFGPTHLRALARGLAKARDGERAVPATFSAAGALARNLALYPVVLAHGLRRLIPW